jgi:HEPN domain-containing protein
MKPREVVKRELVNQWLEKAEEDLGVAEHLLSEGVYLSAVGFHAQQAAEKFLKALLVEHQIGFPKTHDIGLLLDLAATVIEEISGPLRDVMVLNAYGVDARYPGDLPNLSLDEARNAVSLSCRVREQVLDRIGKGS